MNKTNLNDLRTANKMRNVEWQATSTQGSKYELSFRGCELAGEAGEVCNVVKKLERERLGFAGSRDSIEHLAEELADVIICADLIGMKTGIDIWNAVVKKFNATSSKLGVVGQTWRHQKFKVEFMC